MPCVESEQPAAGRDDPEELAHRQRRVVAVLEHLDAEDDVEAAVFDAGAPRRAAQLAPGFSTGSTPMYEVAYGAKSGSYGFSPQPTSRRR